MEAAGRCPSSLLESMLWRWRRRRRDWCWRWGGGGESDTLESSETFSRFQKVKMSGNRELMSQGAVWSGRGGGGFGGGVRGGF